MQRKLWDNCSKSAWCVWSGGMLWMDCMDNVAACLDNAAASLISIPVFVCLMSCLTLYFQFCFKSWLKRYKLCHNQTDLHWKYPFIIISCFSCALNSPETTLTEVQEPQDLVYLLDLCTSRSLIWPLSAPWTFLTTSASCAEDNLNLYVTQLSNPF